MSHPLIVYIYINSHCSPINFLNPRHRVAYSLACSAQCSLWLELLIIATAIDIGVDKYLDFLIKGI